MKIDSRHCVSRALHVACNVHDEEASVKNIMQYAFLEFFVKHAARSSRTFVWVAIRLFKLPSVVYVCAIGASDSLVLSGATPTSGTYSYVLRYELLQIDA